MSSLAIGIVGLPNVGKSTLFNALVRNSQAQAANYPFCTIDPNVGMVEVPDSRLKVLSDISKSKQIVPAIVEFVDIAGLVAGASKGEGLGNKFLANIRETDAICEVVRVFEDSNITHVANEINPVSDIKTIETELGIKDLETVEKRLETLGKDIRAGNKEAIKQQAVLNKIKPILEAGQMARSLDLSDDDLLLIKELGLLTLKPMIYVVNISENQISNPVIASETKQSIEKIAAASGLAMTNVVILCAKIEAELNELSEADKQEYLTELGIEHSGMEVLAQKAYETLGLITYLTSGEKETRAWTIKKGWTAPQAAGVIHGDFERGFIAADVVKYQDFIDNNGWAGCKEKGLIKTQGRDYIMSDGDIVLFKFNV